MRLVQVAKALGMTGQQLRKELSQVNFGVKPTDREVPDTLAKGIVRFLANKYNLSVNADTIGLQPIGDEDEEGDEGAVAETQTSGTVQTPASAAPSAHREAPTHAEALNVLRKLTLEDVSKDAISRQKRQMEHAQPRGSAGPSRGRSAAIARPKRGMGEVTAKQEQIKRKEGIVLLPDSVSVKELSEKLGVQVPAVIQALMKNGVLATITQSIDYDTAAIVGAELGITVQREQRAAKAEDLISRNLEELLKDEPENLVARPPVVVVMGHVDHGKTALLDAIRSTNVVAQESGGITQHIGAYQVEHAMSGSTEKRRITFLDTPGHEAFTAMRARGAQVTDIVILLVSAEEGVKATTVEAINHAKEAEVPIIAVISKIDKERADPDRVKGELASHGIQPEEWGGQVPVLLTSAVTKQGIPELLDHILLIADVQSFKANPKRSAVATVIESHLDPSLGPVATVIVNTGTLRVGDICICGETMGRVRTMVDASGTRLSEVPPSGPARVSGLTDVPRVGDLLQVMASERAAKSLMDAMREAAGARRSRSFSDLVSRLSEGKILQLKIVLKADAQGSLEAIEEALSRLTGDGGASAKVIHSGVGAVSESDVMMAAASDGMVLAFHVPVPSEVAKTAEREGVKVRSHTILYEILDEVDALLKGLVEPAEEEKVLGHLEVRAVFFSKRSEQIVGGKVTDGILKRVQFRLLRGGEVVGTGRILSIKHVDKDIKEAKEGSECGMRVETTVPIQEGDVLEAFNREFKKKESVK